MRRPRNDGFTMIEMVIVITLIGILTTLAIAGYRQLGLRARSVEAALNLGEIYAAEVIYKAEQETYRACAVHPRPDAALDGGRVRWTDLSVDFRLIGFRPEGAVFFNYRVEPLVDIMDDFVIIARADLDEDGKPASYHIRSGQKAVIRDNGEY